MDHKQFYSQFAQETESVFVEGNAFLLLPDRNESRLQSGRKAHRPFVDWESFSVDELEYVDGELDLQTRRR
jgi:hypothetical protein